MEKLDGHNCDTASGKWRYSTGNRAKIHGNGFGKMVLESWHQGSGNGNIGPESREWEHSNGNIGPESREREHGNGNAIPGTTGTW